MDQIPKVFFQNSEFKNPLKTVIVQVESCIPMKRGFTKRTIYNEITDYIKEELEFVDQVYFGETWILKRVFTAGDHSNVQASNMIGVYRQHSNKTLFYFARDVSEIIYTQGFKDEVLEYIIARILLDIPKLLSKKYRVTENENDYIVEKK